MIVYADFFTGIAGCVIAAELVGFTPVLFCEIEEFPRRLLKHYWPEVPILHDIRTVTADDVRGIGRIDVAHFSPPCQSLSIAGKQEATEDLRYLWPDTARVISLLRPTWVCIENVDNAANLVLDDWIADLDRLGYDTAPIVLPAAAVGAPHLRKRLHVIGRRRDDDAEARHSLWRFMSAMRNRADETEIFEWSSGTQCKFQGEEVLQSSLFPNGPSESISEKDGSAQSLGKESREAVQSLRNDGEAGGPPQGPQHAEQRPPQSRDPVLIVSHAPTLGRRSGGELAEASDLHPMQQTSSCQGDVPKPLQPVNEGGLSCERESSSVRDGFSRTCRKGFRTWPSCVKVAHVGRLERDDGDFGVGEKADQDRVPRFSSTAVGAPHIRNRLYLVAHAKRVEPERKGEYRFMADPTSEDQGGEEERERVWNAVGHSGSVVADSNGFSLERDWPDRLPIAGEATTASRCRCSSRGGGTATTTLGDTAFLRHERPWDSWDGRHGSESSDPCAGTGEQIEPRLGGDVDVIPGRLDRYTYRGLMWNGWPAGKGPYQYDDEPPRTGGELRQRRARIKAIGNAVPPMQIYPIFKAIADEIRSCQ